MGGHLTMNPHRKTMIENKHIQVGDNNYRLTIIKYIDDYTAYLSDISSQFSVSRRLTKSNLNPKDINDWILSSDRLNDPEASFFAQLKQWDGVVL